MLSMRVSYEKLIGWMASKRVSPSTSEARIVLHVTAEARVCIALPLEANVLFITLHPTKVPFVRRG